MTSPESLYATITDICRNLDGTCTIRLESEWAEPVHLIVVNPPRLDRFRAAIGTEVMVFDEHLLMKGKLWAESVEDGKIRLVERRRRESWSWWTLVSEKAGQ